MPLDAAGHEGDPREELLALQCDAIACEAALAGVDRVLEPRLLAFRR